MCSDGCLPLSIIPYQFLTNKVAYQWNANLYQQKHAFVFHQGSGLIDWLNPQLGEKILDLGCGTGELTAELSQSGAEITGIDRSEEMIQRARQQYPQLSFYVEDATQLNGLPQFDAVFSNAALHWMLDAQQVIQQVYQHLQPRGRFVAELGGKNNIAQIVAALNEQRVRRGYSAIETTEQWFFPSLGEYSCLLENTDFEVRISQYFHRNTALDGKDGVVNWMRMFANKWLADLSKEEQDTVLSDAQDMLYPSLFREGTWYADYKRLRILAVKA